MCGPRAEDVEHVPQRQDATNRRVEGRRRRGRLRLLVADRSVLRDHVAHRPVLLRRVAGLIERRVVVIARDDREIGPLVVRTVGESEVRTAVEHVDVDRRTTLEQLVEAACGLLDRREVVVAPPVVEPAVPELRAHQRAGRLVPAQGVEALGRAGAERPGPVQLGDAAVLEHVVGRLVDRRQGHRDADPPVDGDELAQVRLVGAVRAVLVLDLHQDDRAAAIDLSRHQDWRELLEVGGDGRHVARLVLAHPGDAVAEQPRRQAAVGPLRADVRSGPHDRVHALRGHGVEERREVEVAREVELVLPGRVRVPGDVRLDGVQTHLTGLADPVRPEIWMDAEVVDRAGQDPERLAVQQEVVLADRECHAGSFVG